MPTLMLRPDWPNTFRRTVRTGRKPKRLEFRKGEPVQVTDAEFLAMAEDVGLAVFEVEFDDKQRPRYIERDAVGENEPHVADVQG